jgi:ankyrin repeat protein
VAAQGDAARSIYVFIKEKKIDINMQDRRGGSPLHWACHSNAEMALSYILALKPNINLQDIDGFTPLHLAVKAVDSLQSTRCVRYLLLHGARNDIKDKRGKVPADYVKSEVMTRQLQSELLRMLVSK